MSAADISKTLQLTRQDKEHNRQKKEKVYFDLKYSVEG